MFWGRIRRCYCDGDSRGSRKYRTSVIVLYGNRKVEIRIYHVIDSIAVLDNRDGATHSINCKRIVGVPRSDREAQSLVQIRV
jgi:hypothetical protein